MPHDRRGQCESGDDRGDREEATRSGQILRHRERGRGADVRARGGADAVLDRELHHLFGLLVARGCARAREHVAERDRGRQAVGELGGTIDAARDALGIERTRRPVGRTSDDHEAGEDQQRDADARIDPCAAHGDHRDQGERRGGDRRRGSALERTLEANPPAGLSDQPLDHRGISRFRHGSPEVPMPTIASTFEAPVRSQV